MINIFRKMKDCFTKQEKEPENKLYGTPGAPLGLKLNYYNIDWDKVKTFEDYKKIIRILLSDEIVVNVNTLTNKDILEETGCLEFLIKLENK